MGFLPSFPTNHQRLNPEPQQPLDNGSLGFRVVGLGHYFGGLYWGPLI